MLASIRQTTIVQPGGNVSIFSPELPDGAHVEVIVIVEPQTKDAAMDETEYLLSNEANKHHLLTAIERAERRENLVVFTPEEWNAQYGI
jgi:antitoxin YefM